MTSEKNEYISLHTLVINIQLKISKVLTFDNRNSSYIIPADLTKYKVRNDNL